MQISMPPASPPEKQRKSEQMFITLKKSDEGKCNFFLCQAALLTFCTPCLLSLSLTKPDSVLHHRYELQDGPVTSWIVTMTPQMASPTLPREEE